DAVAPGGRAAALAPRVRMALGAGQERLGARPHQLHRPSGLERKEPEVALDRDVLLAAEAAAEIGADHADAVLRDAERLGDVAEVLDHLRGHTDRDDAVVVEGEYATQCVDAASLDPRHARLGLQGRGGHAPGRVLAVAAD